MPNSLESISELFQAVSAPARLEILLIIGAGESCVCYLEAQLGYRQAYISQHLMAMRQAGLIESRREGKFVFYRLLKPEIMPLLHQAAKIIGVSLPVIEPVSPQAQCALSVDSIDTLIVETQERNS
ncbi:MAG: metalloregulator ArsR/SmtB family transcription factor [Chloroflexi bacterium]|nr:metalloregulator ArsR/SmtB family transcription factor [Chloroflexota bacterium]